MSIELPDGTVTEVETFPVPEPEVHVPVPICAAHVHVGFSRPAGKVSCTAAFVTVEGPLFETTMSHVFDAPGMTVVFASSFAMDRSPVGVA
jgi:hypothetical protein